MTQNIPKHSVLVLSATCLTCGRLVIYIVFAHGAHESVGRKFFFCSEAEKKLFCINFDGSVGQPETRLFFFRPYNEESESSSLLLSHCRYFDRTF